MPINPELRKMLEENPLLVRKILAKHMKRRYGGSRRNSWCVCGSKVKYKNCCGRES